MIQNLGQLTDAKLAGPLHALVVMFASGSPRDMVQVCQEILSEQLRIGPSAAKIDLDAILEGITKFSVKRSQELLAPHVIRELAKVRRLEFTTNHIANNVFKIEVNTTQNKIRLWEQMGVVERIGEIHTGGRPVLNPFSLSELTNDPMCYCALGMELVTTPCAAYAGFARAGLTASDLHIPQDSKNLEIPRKTPMQRKISSLQPRVDLITQA